jgi:predicted phosphodiesterase
MYTGSMKIQLVSDLHLDMYDMALPGGDVLILAGDICEAREYGKANYNKDWVMKPGDNPGRREDRWKSRALGYKNVQNSRVYARKCTS